MCEVRSPGLVMDWANQFKRFVECLLNRLKMWRQLFIRSFNSVFSVPLIIDDNAHHSVELTAYCGELLGRCSRFFKQIKAINALEKNRGNFHLHQQASLVGLRVSDLCLQFEQFRIKRKSQTAGLEPTFRLISHILGVPLPPRHPNGDGDAEENAKGLHPRCQPRMRLDPPFNRAPKLTHRYMVPVNEKLVNRKTCLAFEARKGMS